jgi:serine/threonine protein kinase
MKNYELKEIIGYGSYGKVYKAINRNTLEKCAIKKLNFKVKSLRELNNLNEIACLTILKHENIIKLLDVFREQNGGAFIVFELAEKSLRDVIVKYNDDSRFMSERKIKKIIFGLLKGLEYIHTKGYIHKDIKPENLLIIDNKLKICDFGFCAKDEPREYIGTRVYRAPECLLRLTDIYSSALDIWSVGVILLELLTNKVMFDGDNESVVISKIVNFFGLEELTTWNEGYYLLKRKGYIRGLYRDSQLSNLVHNSPEAFDLLTKLLRLDPLNRLTAREALSHPYFKELREIRTERNNYGFSNYVSNMRRNFLNVSKSENNNTLPDIYQFQPYQPTKIVKHVFKRNINSFMNISNDYSIRNEPKIKIFDYEGKV